MRRDGSPGDQMRSLALCVAAAMLLASCKRNVASARAPACAPADADASCEFDAAAPAKPAPADTAPACGGPAETVSDAAAVTPDGDIARTALDDATGQSESAPPNTLADALDTANSCSPTTPPQPASSLQACLCWPDGTHCDLFMGAGKIKHDPAMACPQGEKCMGSFSVVNEAWQGIKGHLCVRCAGRATRASWWRSRARREASVIPATAGA